MSRAEKDVEEAGKKRERQRGNAGARFIAPGWETAHAILSCHDTLPCRVRGPAGTSCRFRRKARKEGVCAYARDAGGAAARAIGGAGQRCADVFRGGRNHTSGAGGQ